MALTTSASATAVGVPFNPGAQLFSRSSSSLWMATCSAYSSPSGHTWQARLLLREADATSQLRHLIISSLVHRTIGGVHCRLSSVPHGCDATGESLNLDVTS